MFLIRGRRETLYAARRQLTASSSRCPAPPRCGGGANESVFGATDSRHLAVPPSGKMPGGMGVWLSLAVPFRPRPVRVGDRRRGARLQTLRHLGAGLLIPKPLFAITRPHRRQAILSTDSAGSRRRLPGVRGSCPRRGFADPVRGVTAGTREGPAPDASYRPTASRSTSATHRTCHSSIPTKKGSAIERAATSSQIGKSPGWWPKRSR